MRTTALIANVGLLVVMTWYLLSIRSFQAEGVELLALVLALATSILSIIALVMSRLWVANSWFKQQGAARIDPGNDSASGNGQGWPTAGWDARPFPQASLP